MFCIYIITYIRININRYIQYIGIRMTMEIEGYGTDAVAPYEPTVRDNAEHWIATLTLSESSRKSYGKKVRAFVSWLEDNGRALDEDALADYRNTALEGMKPSSCNAYLQCAKQFSDWCYHRGLIAREITYDVKGKRAAEGHLRDELSVEQVRALLDGLNADTLEGARQKAIVTTIAYLGLRSVEISRMNFEDVRYRHGKRTVAVFGKGRSSADQILPMPDAVYTAIQEYVDMSRRMHVKEGDPIFVTICNRSYGDRLRPDDVSRIVKRAIKDILGIDDRRITTHSLRHAFGTALAESGAPIDDLRRAMRHRSIETSLIYIHSAENIENGCFKTIEDLYGGREDE